VRDKATDFASGAPASALNASGWSTQEWLHFLSALPATLSPSQVIDLDATFGLTGRGNSEVLFAWLRMAIQHHYEAAMPALERFLTTQGRRRFVRPLYEDLLGQEWGRQVARRIYARARPLYHSVVTSTLDPMLL
jgi:hypothetical protein